MGVKRIALVAYHFPPENAAGAARPYRFYRYLPEIGYQRHVFTAADPGRNRMEDVTWIPDRLGSYWDGRQDVLPARMDRAAELFVRRFILPGAVGAIWSRDVARAFRQFAGQHRDEKLTVFATFPPVGCPLAALRIGRMAGVRIIADYRDPFSFAADIGTRAAKLIDEWTFRRADLVIANTEAAAAKYRQAFPWAAHKVHTIWNGFDPEDDIGSLPIPERPYRVLTHAGSIYVGRSPDPILHSVMRLRAVGSSLAETLRVELVGPLGYGGTVDPDAVKRGEADGWLRFVPKQIAKSEAQRLTREADFLLLLQPQSSMQVPAKLFEYIRIGRPILAYAPKGSSIEWLLERAGVPFCCIYPEDQPDEIDGKLMKFLEIPSGPYTASSWFLDQFDARRQTQHLAELIERLP